jgi:hypothetical protein
MITSNLVGVVIGDNRPITDITLTKTSDGTPVDVSDGGTSVKFRFRPVGDEAATPIEITCSKPNGGADGVVRFAWGDTLDAIAPGTYEYEIVVQYGANDIYTTYEKAKFKVRDHF